MEIKGFIKDDEERDEILRFIEGCMLKGEEMTEEEERLYLLCWHLVELYEKDLEEEPVSPLNVLRHLMEGRNETLESIACLMDDCSLDPLKGKRPFSPSEAERLGLFYHVDKSVFLENDNDFHD